MGASRVRVRGYEIWGLLSEGGMSEIWLAKHTALAVPAVIKTLRKQVFDPMSTVVESPGPGFDRMLQEARLMARIPSPRVVRAIDAGEEDGIGYVVQEYVDGIDLAELDARRRESLGVGLPLWFVARVVGEVCLALHASHQTGVLHRDVKPSNVFGSPDTGIRLGDFGIAVPYQVARASSESSGTLRFMAPEQVRGEALDTATDVFGIGATACDLRYGHPPFADLQALLSESATPAFPAPRSAEEAYFQHIVARMLSRDARKRPRDLPALARRLRTLEDGLRPRRGCLRLGARRLRFGDCEISFEAGDIANASADGIVSSAHDHMRMRAGVGDALRRRGGDVIEEESLRAGVQALGSCVATGAGTLDARCVLHAVSAWNEVSTVGRAMHRAFLKAEELGLRSLAIPAVGTGASRVTLETCASALGTTLRHHLMLGGSRLRSVKFVLRDDAALEAFSAVATAALIGDEASAEPDIGLEAELAPVRVDAATHVQASLERG